MVSRADCWCVPLKIPIRYGGNPALGTRIMILPLGFETRIISRNASG